jgi:hypothetical protein
MSKFGANLGDDNNRTISILYVTYVFFCRGDIRRRGGGEEGPSSFALDEGSARVIEDISNTSHHRRVCILSTFRRLG